MRILVVEDDALLLDALQSGLRQAGFAVDGFPDARRALAALASTPYELIVLDLGLPGMDGLEMLRTLRAARRELPVLVLTARDTVADRVSGLDAGADDYLIKPFDMEELAARVRALLRRAHARGAPLITHGDLVIDPAAREVRRENKVIDLSAKEFAVLMELLEHRGVAMSREQLEESLYGWNEEIDSNAVEVHIHHLRRKLGADLIHTLRGVGYVIRKV